MNQPEFQPKIPEHTIPEHVVPGAPTHAASTPLGGPSPDLPPDEAPAEVSERPHPLTPVAKSWLGLVVVGGVVSACCCFAASASAAALAAASSAAR